MMEDKKMVKRKLCLYSAAVLVVLAVFSCTLPDNSTPKRDYTFHSDRLDITHTGDVLSISFEDAAGTPVAVEGEFIPGADNVLYDANSTVLTLTAEGRVELAEPYTDASGNDGASTYSVSDDKTGRRMYEAGGRITWDFYFAHKDSGEVEYTATLIQAAGEMAADFGTTLGQTPVSITYYADTSVDMTFDNLAYAQNCGTTATINVAQPAIYANVTATLGRLSSSWNELHVYKRSNGNYIVDYYDSTGYREYHNIDLPIPGTGETTIPTAVGTIVIKSTGEVFLTEPIGGGTRIQAINPEGMVVQDDQVLGDHTYYVHFVDQNSGRLEYTANIVEVTPGVWEAQFQDPINEDVQVTRETDVFNNVKYAFNFDNDAGSGTILFWTDPAGELFSTTYNHSFTAILGYESAIISFIMSIIFYSMTYVFTSAVQDPGIGLIFAAISAGFLSLYFMAGALRYYFMGRNVRNAVYETLLEKHWQENQTKHKSFAKLQANPGAYVNWLASIPKAKIAEMKYKAPRLPVAKSNGWIYEPAMNRLRQQAPGTARLVLAHEQYKTDLAGMLALLPGVQAVRNFKPNLVKRLAKIRNPYVQRLFSFFFSSIPLAGLVAGGAMFTTSCELSTEPEQEEPEEEVDKQYYKSDKLDIWQQGDTLIIKFTVNGQVVEKQGKLDGFEHVLYNENDVKLVITADRLVELTEPYVDVHDQEGTSTYSVREDLTAVQRLATRGVYDFVFYFADKTTAEVLYFAELTQIDGDLYAVFKNLYGEVQATELVTVTYYQDTSKKLEFPNPLNGGDNVLNMEVDVPVLYENVQATLANMRQLKVYEREDGSYILDYFASNGKLLKHGEEPVPGTDTPIYNQNGVTIVLKSTGEVFLTEPLPGGTRIQAVNPEGMVVQDNHILGEHTYYVHFVDQISGILEYTANIEQIGPDWYARFPAPINQDILMTEHPPDFDGNIMYEFSFNNAAGEGTVSYLIDGDNGNLLSTGYVHPFTAALGYGNTVKE
jgi:hypothetical protein